MGSEWTSSINKKMKERQIKKVLFVNRSICIKMSEFDKIRRNTLGSVIEYGIRLIKHNIWGLTNEK